MMYSLLYNSLFTHVASNELKSSFKIRTIYVKYVYSQLYYYNPNKTDYRINHNYIKIVKSDWLSTALISALIGQFDRKVRVMPK